MLKCFRFCTVAISIATALGIPRAAQADPETFHLIVINEVYSNTDGTLQYIELKAGSSFQTNLGATRITAFDSTGTTETLVFDFTASFPALDNNETILLATAGMSFFLSNPPDFTIPDGSIPRHSGRLIFKQDPLTINIVDAVAYGNYTGSNTGYGTPAPALPSNGCQSLQRTRIVFPPSIRDNSTDFAMGTPSPQSNGHAPESVTCPPQAPVLNPIGSKSVNEGQLLSFGISATDANNDPLTMSAMNVPAGAVFNNLGSGTASFVWTPSYLQSAVYHVLFIASDGALADSEDVTITVNEVTNPPTARDSSASGPEDIAIAGQLQGFDPDGNPLTYTITSGPFHGNASGLVMSTGAFNYQPASNYNGTDSLFFRVSDGIAPPDTGVWRVTLTPVNDPPHANDVNLFVVVNTPASAGAMPISDVDNGSWTVSQDLGPFHGAVSNFNATTGAFDYSPALDYVGPDSIRYQANDGQDPSNQAFVRISVTTGCHCSCHADPQCDSVIDDVLDVSRVINVAFRGSASLPDPDNACPYETTDVDCNSATDVLDVTKVINVAFRGQSTLSQFCVPCP